MSWQNAYDRVTVLREHRQLECQNNGLDSWSPQEAFDLWWANERHGQDSIGNRSLAEIFFRAGRTAMRQRWYRCVWWKWWELRDKDMPTAPEETEIDKWIARWDQEIEAIYLGTRSDICASIEELGRRYGISYFARSHVDDGRSARQLAEKVYLAAAHGYNTDQRNSQRLNAARYLHSHACSQWRKEEREGWNFEQSLRTKTA